MLPTGTVTLYRVEGDQESFIDLVGCQGRIQQTREGFTFFPHQRNDWLVFHKPTLYFTDHLVIHTTLGNTFHFRLSN